MSFQIGDRVVVNDTCLIPSERGRHGVVTRVDAGGSGARVLLDGSDYSLGYYTRSLDHAAPELPYGLPEQARKPMTSEDLAREVEDFIGRATARIAGVGQEQYDDGEGQKFERLPLNNLFDWAQEELEDIANYAAMLSIRIGRVKQAVIDGGIA